MNYSFIKINHNKRILYIQENKSLLNILETNNVQIDYQCRSGYCGICRVKLIKGQVAYFIKQPMAALYEKKEIFPCCCKPCGNIVIDI